jgi:hypothetical protein
MDYDSLCKMLFSKFCQEQISDSQVYGPWHVRTFKKGPMNHHYWQLSLKIWYFLHVSFFNCPSCIQTKKQTHTHPKQSSDYRSKWIPDTAKNTTPLSPFFIGYKPVCTYMEPLANGSCLFFAGYDHCVYEFGTLSDIEDSCLFSRDTNLCVASSCCLSTILVLRLLVVLCGTTLLVRQLVLYCSRLVRHSRWLLCIGSGCWRVTNVCVCKSSLWRHCALLRMKETSESISKPNIL